jgi:aerobic carbon-monoxide dehydrogenase medium subunit
VKPAPFEFVAPTSLDAAISILRIARQAGGRARLLAGGQSLMPQLKQRDERAEIIVWTRKIEELSHLERAHDGWHIGASTTAARLEEAGRGTPLAGIGTSVGPPAVRSCATIGGGIVSALTTSDWLVRLAACSARCLLVGPEGRAVRRAVGEAGVFPTDGIITEIIVPPQIDDAELYVDRVGSSRNAVPDANIALMFRRKLRCAKVAFGTRGGSFATFDLDGGQLDQIAGQSASPTDIAAIRLLSSDDAGLVAPLLGDLVRATRDREALP